MALPSISRFQTAIDSAEPDHIFHAPLIAPEGEHDFRDVIQAFADDRTLSGINHYFSFSNWDGGHSQAAHVASTCLTLAYSNDAAAYVHEVLTIGEVAFYAFGVKDGRRNATMFALPLADHLDFNDTIRVANIVADVINHKGVISNSYLPTHFFHFAKGVQIGFTPGIRLGANLLEEYNGVRLDMRKWLA